MIAMHCTLCSALREPKGLGRLRCVMLSFSQTVLDGRALRYPETVMRSCSLLAALDPGADLGVSVQRDARPLGNLHPRENLDVSDRVASADYVVLASELVLDHLEQTNTCNVRCFC